MTRRVILDENVPAQLAPLLQGCTVTTVSRQGWAGVRNGELLRRIEGQFDVLVTADRNIYAQQKLTGRSIALLVVPTNRKRELLALAPVIAAALPRNEPSTLRCSAMTARSAFERIDARLTPSGTGTRGRPSRASRRRIR